jgi:hypothetical protein
MADITFTVPERTTQKLTFTLKDETGAVIPGSSLTTCTLTLYDQTTGAIINNRNGVDVKANIDGQGVMTFTFLPADGQILNDALMFEPHVALFQWTYNTGNSRGEYEVALVVRNVRLVP